MKKVLLSGSVRHLIYLLRGQQVMLDADLANLYGVTTFNLNKAVKRNPARFPREFMFQLSNQEYENLIFQNGISSAGSHGGRRHLPYAFTQEGVAMLSSVLRSKRATQVNIQIMKAYIGLRRMTLNRLRFKKRLVDLEKRVAAHDIHIRDIFSALRRMLDPPSEPRRSIGFGR